MAEVTDAGADPGWGTSALFLAWQDDRTRRWFPIGKLTRDLVGFSFRYLEGFALAAEQGLTPLPPFPELGRTYRSDHLFPFFRNRVMNRAREDFEDWLRRMGYVEADALTPDELAFEVLARSRGRRSTDRFELFPHPLVREGGRVRFRIECFVHGVRHTKAAAQSRALALQPGEALSLVPEPDNPADRQAVAVFEPSGLRVGYLPRYYGADVGLLLAREVPLEARVERVNPPPVPAQQRLLMSLDAPWPRDARALDSAAYRPLAGSREEAS